MKMAEIQRRMAAVYDENPPSYDMVSRWFHRFENGDFSFDDKERSGRPQELDLDKLRKEVEDDPFLTTRDLSLTLNTHYSTVARGLKSIGKVRKLGRFIPHQLTQRDKNRRADMAASLLTRHRTFAWLDSIITGDEKYIQYDNNARRAQWTDVGEEPLPFAKPGQHPKKIMLCIFWSVRGVEYYELLDEGTTLDGQGYATQLRELKAEIESRRGKSDKVVFQMDNARPHVSNVARSQLIQSGWEILPHPPYSPDLAPSDFHLFSDMQRAFEGKNFKNRADLEKQLAGYLSSKDAAFWRRGIESLPARWRKTVDADGDYFV